MWEHLSPRCTIWRRSSSKTIEAPWWAQQDRPSVRVFMQTKSRRRCGCSFTRPPLSPDKAAAIDAGIIAHADLAAAAKGTSARELPPAQPRRLESASLDLCRRAIEGRGDDAQGVDRELALCQPDLQGGPQIVHGTD
jgi:hypothetical protein